MSEPGTDLMLPNGVIVDMTDPGQVAVAYDDLQQLRRMVAEAERTLKAALVFHGRDTLGKNTFTIEGVGKVQIEGGKEKRYDAQGLKRALTAAGMPPERVKEIVRETIELKVMGKEANAAAKANPKYEEIIKEFVTVEEKTPTVTVTRIGGGRGTHPHPDSRTVEAEKTVEASPNPADVMPWEEG
jgi:hypothetical protein